MPTIRTFEDTPRALQLLRQEFTTQGETRLDSSSISAKTHQRQALSGSSRSWPFTGNERMGYMK